MSESPDIVYGRLLESAHISGYGFERMCDELEWLLDEDRWKKVSPGFGDGRAFLASIDLSSFNIDAKRRKPLVRKTKAVLDAPNTAIAKTVGVNESTVRADLKPDSGNPESQSQLGESDQQEQAGDSGNPESGAAASFERSEKDVAKANRQASERQRKEAERERERQRNAEAVESGSTLTAPSGRFATVVFDPPWSWEDEDDVSQLGRARPRYHTMTFDEIRQDPIGGRPIAEYAADDAHIYLWITNRSLPKGFALLEAWGFRYITTLTWCKPHYGMGNYFRGSTEHVLFGVKGSLSLLRKDVGTWFDGDRGDGHSAKPDSFYQLVEQCSPGPWVDILGRRERPGWATVKAIETTA